MASALPPILVEIQADVASLKKGLADAQNALKGIDDSVNKTGSAMTTFMDKLKNVGATLGVAFAGTQVIQFFRDSITAANDASNAQERLATLLRNTNGGTEAQIKALYEQAEALEAVGVVSKDNIIVAQSQLATFDLTAGTINKLTPAILDYVTAEKGAAASADDYRQMTNSLAQALNGNFASLSRVGFVLDETTKKQISSGTESERAAAIVEVLNSTYKGFNETLRDNNPLQAAINDLDKLKGDIGEALLPIIDELSRFISNVLIPGFRNLAKFVSENKEAILTFTGVLAAGYAAMKLYRGMIILTTTAKSLMAVATTLLRGKQLATIASTNGMAASMLALNAAMRANPIGIVVTALALLAAAIVTAWKKSETFRSVVISVAKAALNAFASIIPMISKVYEAIVKVVTGPMRLFLTALSKLPGVGKLAKSGLDTINKGLDGISDLGDKAAAKAKALSAELDKMGKAAKKAGKEAKDATDPFKGDTRGDKGGGLTDKEKSKLESYNKKVKDIYQDMKDVVAKAQEDAEEALTRRNERIAEAQERYHERVAELNARYAEQIAEAEERHSEKVADLKARFNEQIAEAEARAKEIDKEARAKHAAEIIEITKEFDRKEAELKAAHQDKLQDLQQRALEKTADLTRKAAEKQAEIVQKSVERLTGAFASGTAVSIMDAFKKGGEGGGLVSVLKKQLDDVKKLQEAAGYLAGQGYSQTFIEQVVKAGPEAGLALVADLKAASPEQQQEIRNTFNELEKISDSGLDTLAASMNSGANLATSELRKAYNQVAIDLKESLNEVNAELTKNMAEQQEAFDKAMANNVATRDQKLAESYDAMMKAIAKAQADLDEARVKAQAALDKGLREADEALAKARKKAQEDLDKALAEAQATLQKALTDAQKEYEKAIDKINESTQKKLEELKRKLAEVAALIAAIAGAQAQAAAMAAAPRYTPIVPVAGPVATTTTTPVAGNATTVNITGVNLTSPQETASTVVNSIKFGNVVIPTVPARLQGESGAIGAAYMSANTTKATFGGGGGRYGALID